MLSFPIPMRYWLQSNRRLYAHIHKLVIREIDRDCMNKAKAIGIKDPKPGSVSFTQRFGSALDPILTTQNLAMPCSYLLPWDLVKSKHIL